MKAIVTGHTRGLGEAITGELLARGIPVLGLSRTRSAALAARFPAMLQQFEIDLSDSVTIGHWLRSGAVQDFFEDCGVVLLINNAGTVQPIGPLQEQDPLTVGDAVALNIAAPLMLSAGVVAATSGCQWRIVHLSSGAGRSAYPGWSVYGATKAALDQHARAAALDAVPGLRLCSLAPGVINTDMQAEIRASAIEHFPNRERFVEMERSGQLSEPVECAGRLIDYLLDERFGSEPVADLRTV